MIGKASVLPRLVGGRFRTTSLMKEGQGLETWLGEDRSTGRAVVLKLTSASTVSPAALQRLEHTAQALADLGSPFVTAPLATGQDDDTLFVAQPWLSGTTLRERLARHPLGLRDSVRLGGWLMMGLGHAHAQGVLHGDLKPSNIIVNEDPELRRATLVDFGLSRSSRIQSSIRDLPLATVRYLSPEQAGLIEGEASERSDLYAAGAVLFECLAGRPLVAGDTVTDLLRQLVSIRPPVLRALGLAVPRALDEVIQRLLHKDPQDRYYSAEGALADLAAIDEALSRGDSEPVMVVGARDQRPTLTEPAFVGRGRDLARLQEAVEQARRGQGHLVLLQAGSGGGKTRLLDELGTRTGMGAWVLRGQGVAAQAPRPFQLLVGVAQQLIQAAARDPAGAQAIRERTGEQADAVCAALPELSPVLEPRDPEKLGPEDFGEARSVHALSGLLDALGNAARPALVILDDAQWADEATCKLLRHWQDRRRPAKGRDHTVLVVSYRAEEVGPEHPLRHIEGASRMTLSPLDAGDIRQLAESMAGALPPEALKLVAEFSDGSPFMAGAVLRGMVESGALLREPQGWQVEPSALDNVRSSRAAGAFLARRLELLPPAALDLLSMGAVLGKEFALDLAAELAGQGSAEARLSLAEARRRHMVWIRADASRAVFVHDKIREALLGRLASDDRAALHRRAAAALEERDRGASFDIAYHYDAAGESERALPHALSAGARARAQYALALAEQQYRIAARGALAAAPPVRLQVAEGLGDVLTLRGRYEDAAGELARARELAASDVERARLDHKLGDLAFKRGNMEESAQLLERALALLHRPAPRGGLGMLLGCCKEAVVQALHTMFPRLLVGRRPVDSARAEEEMLEVRLLSRLAHAYWFGWGKVACAWAHLREMNLAERYPPTPELAQAYSEHAPVATMVPWFRRGITYAEKSLAIRKALGDIWGQGQSLHFYGVVLYGASRYQACIDKCREAIRLLERTGDRWEIHTATWHIAFSQYRLGQLRSARDLAERLYADGSAIGDAQANGMSLGAWAKASGGQVPDELIEVELKRRTGDVATTAEILQAKALRLLRLGRPAEAVAVLDRADAISCGRGFRQEYVAPIRPWLATALRAQLEATSALAPRLRRQLRRRLAKVVPAALRFARAYRNNLPHALREAGLLAAMRGRPGRARDLLNRSAALAGEQNARYELAETLLARGKVGEPQGWPGAAADLVQARELLNDMELRGGNPRRSLTPGAVTLSLAERFDQIMDRGRQLASALSRDAVKESVRAAALALLRGERVVIVDVEVDATGQMTLGQWPEGAPLLAPQLLERAISEGRPLLVGEAIGELTGEGAASPGIRSALVAPIRVRAQPVACLCVTHSQIGRLFGEEEEQLAQFITALAGAAWENAEGFSRVEQAVRARDDFLAIASHELKTPLTPLQLQLDSLRRSLERAGMKEPQVRSALDMMDRQVDRLTNLVQSLLDVARIAGGRLELQPEDVDLGELVREVALRFGREAEQAGSKLEVTTDGVLPLRGRWDPTRLEQVVTNLLSNAIKYGAGKPIAVRVTAGPGEVTLEIRDQGIGLSAEDARRIFRRFERAVSSRFYGGLGLGLYITRQITEAHGGEITVTSAPGEGATFRVTLPRIANPGLVVLRRSSEISSPVTVLRR
jgi:signal transduction histidine kinase